MESYLTDTGMAGLAPACAMARRRQKEYRRKVEAVTRCSVDTPLPDLPEILKAYLSLSYTEPKFLIHIIPAEKDTVVS